MDDKKKKITDELLEDDFFAPPDKEEKKPPGKEKKREEEKTSDTGISIEEFDDFFVSPEEGEESSGNVPETVSVEDLSLLESEILKEPEEKTKQSKVDEFIKPPPPADEKIEPPRKSVTPKKVEDVFEPEKPSFTPPARPSGVTEPEIVEVKVISKGAVIGSLIGGFILGSLTVFALNFFGIINISKIPLLKTREINTASVKKGLKPEKETRTPLKNVEKMQNKVAKETKESPEIEKSEKTEEKKEVKVAPSTLPPPPKPAVKVPPPPEPKKVAKASIPPAQPKPKSPPPPPVPKFTLEIGPISSKSKLNSILSTAKSLGIKADVKKSSKTVEKFVVLGEYPNMGKANADKIKAEVLAGIKNSTIQKRGGKVLLIFGEYADVSKAVSIKNNLNSKGIKVKLEPEKNTVTIYRITAGKFATKSKASNAAVKFRKKGVKVNIKNL